jgi:hypothetical protein
MDRLGSAPAFGRAALRAAHPRYVTATRFFPAAFAR